METVLQERIMHKQNNFTSYNNRANNKASRHPSSRRNTNPTVHSQNAKKDTQKDHLSTQNSHSPSPESSHSDGIELHLKGRGSRSDKTSIMVTATTISNQKDLKTKPKFQVNYTNGPGEKHHMRNARHRNTNNRQQLGKLPEPLPSFLTSVSVQRQPQSKQVSHKPRDEDTDSGSDLSETERLPGLPFNTEPSQLHLRDVIDPCDFHLSHRQSRSCDVSRDSYPDFLPPPFNSWSLWQLAVYLNTDGKGMARLKPVSQLERYLERLLQLEWHQIQTIHEESSKSALARRHRPHTILQSSLSAPKSILQFQCAFPLALLSSLTNTPCNRACPLYTYPYHSHLSPLPKQCRKAPRLSRRSSSESRAHRLSDSWDSSCYLKQMQAIGNIRNPAGFTYNLQSVSSNSSIEPSRRKGSGRLSHSCGDVSQDAYRGVRQERRTAAQHLIDSRSLYIAGSGDLHSSKESVGKQKRVQFFIW